VRLVDRGMGRVRDADEEDMEQHGSHGHSHEAGPGERLTSLFATAPTEGVRQ